MFDAAKAAFDRCGGSRAKNLNEQAQIWTVIISEVLRSKHVGHWLFMTDDVSALNPKPWTLIVDPKPYNLNSRP